MCIWSPREKEEREENRKKIFEEKYLKISKFVEKQQIADKISLVNPRKNKMDRKPHLGRSWSSS